MSGGSKAWTWRHAFSQADLAPTTKHLLHTLGMFMNELGEGCYPSVADLVRYSGLDKKTVMKHLATAREKGWISVSQHGYRGQRWKRQEYAACWPDRDVTAACVPLDEDHEGGGAVPPPSETKVVELVPEGGGTEGPKVVEQLHQDKTSPITNPRTSPVERERASAAADGMGEGEGEQAGEAGKPDPATLPGRAAFEKRVMRFLTGEGYQGGEWSKWSGSTLSHIAKQFADLDEADRQAAERWRDAFLAKAAAQGVKVPMPVANYLRDKAWRLLTETEMSRALAAKDRAQAAVSAGSGIAEASRPEGWAVGFGPVWAVALVETLLAGPQRPHPKPENPIWFPGLVRTNWPALAALHSGRGFVAPERLHRLKELMEFVPDDTDVWTAWTALARARGWPDWPRKDGMKGMYFPKGGPDGLAAFIEALARHHSAGEAAE